MADSDQRQFELALPSVPTPQGTSKLWIIAPESRVAPRSHDDSETLWINPEARHCFVCAEGGSEAFGPSDLLLVRCDEPETFRLLIPDGLITNEQAKADLNRSIEQMLHRGNLSGTRPHAEQLTCISFQRGRVSYRQAERCSRSRLERALGRLKNDAKDVSPAEALHEYRVARRLLDPRRHDALDGLIRHASAGVLSRVHAATGAIDCGIQSRAELAAARILYSKAGLRAEAIAADRNGTAQTELLQGCLPFYTERLETQFVDNATEITPVVGMSILLPASILPPIRRCGSVPHYIYAGQMHVRDTHICQIMSESHSSCRKLIAKVVPIADGFAIDAGHVDAISGLLRLKTIIPLCEDVLAITFSSPSLDFDEPLHLPASRQPAHVLARPKQLGPHDIDISMHMMSGRTSTLPFSIPNKIERPITYV